jgi:excisionase family DNA binding protein
MKIIHKPEIDYVSIEFKEGVEAKSFLENGVIVRLDKKGNILGIDITDSSQFFSGDEEMTLQEACELLGVSESTMRRRIKEGKVKFTKPNGKDYRFKKSDILKVS